MQKLLVCLLSVALMLSACGKDDDVENTNSEPNTEKSENLKSTEKTKKEALLNEKWSKIAGNPELFRAEYNKFTPVQQYYFCSAFSLGAMSASKPATASAMVSYFLGLGVEKYSQGINDKTYYAFDIGKNVLRYELVVNYITKVT